MSKRWSVVHAYSGYEKKVAESLRERILRYGMQDRFGDVLVPTEEVIEMRAGQKRKSERKFFPGYVLVQMDLDNDTCPLVKEKLRVMGFIGGKSDNQAHITDKEEETILRRVDISREKTRPRTKSGTGVKVVVKEGQYKDFNGVVEEVNYDQNRLRVAVLISGRSTPVELDFGQVEKA